jgi:superfamily II DNA or RNA helicase
MKPPSWSPSIVPRKWQTIALGKWSKHYRGVASVVTGGGKTVFAQLCMLEAVTRWPSACFVIIVPSITLLDQWYVSMQEDLGVPSNEIATYSGTSKAKEPTRVNIMVINTARQLAVRLCKSLENPCLIVDECHRAGSIENAHSLQGDYRATLGLSATPTREYDSGFIDYVAPALGDIIYEYSYADAARDGVICPFELRNLRIPLSTAESSDLSSVTRAIAKIPAIETDANRKKLERMTRNRLRLVQNASMRIPVAVKLLSETPTSRSLVFHERIDAAHRILKMANQRGINAVEYHTNISSPLRRDNLKLFRRGIFQCLVTCRALDEGANIPETSLAIVASSTRSTRQRIQRLGRVLRPAPGKTHSIIYTLYATDEEENTLVKEAKHLEGLAKVKWLSGSLITGG